MILCSDKAEGDILWIFSNNRKNVKKKGRRKDLILEKKSTQFSAEIGDDIKMLNDYFH